MNSAHSYKNPFSSYNANLMTPREILDFWCNPFFGLRSGEVNEHHVFNHKDPIVFQGGRGTGKTMFLRYFSYEVQAERFERPQGSGRCSVLDSLRHQGAIGIYVRLDGAVVRDFQGRGVSEDMWDKIFCQYFELDVCQKYLEVLEALLANGSIEEGGTGEFVKGAFGLLGERWKTGSRVADVVKVVRRRISEITNFRADASFRRLEFSPTKAFASQDLTYGMPELMLKSIPELDQVRFLLLVDEYENFSASQQQILNTLLKFPKTFATFRIGMRLEGFHTFETISPEEFIKRGRDYSGVVFEDVIIKDRGYREFLSRVAAKRLLAVPLFEEKGWSDITAFLGKKEDLEAEAKELLKCQRKGRHRHFEPIPTHGPAGGREEVIGQIECRANPLFEMLNVLWVLRRKSPEDTRQAMEDYINKRSTGAGAKYKTDYVDKYKLSLMFLMASLHQRDKLYYSFNTFCFLSSGIVGNFIELCRRSFQLAEFEERHNLLEDGRIAPRIQHAAAREFGSAELEMVSRIREYGSALYRFTKNMGNSFRSYHRDFRIRYPETNQFTVEMSAISPEKYTKAFRAAIRWSVVQRKPRLQGASPGKGKGDVYTLNRVFAPVFQISPRTRGGYSVQLSVEQLRDYMDKEEVESPLRKPSRAKPSTPSLFPPEK